MSDLKLYEISEEMSALDEILEQEQGEMTDEYLELEQRITGLLMEKVDSCVGYINKEKDLVVLAKEKIKELKEFVSMRERKIENFSNYVANALNKTGQKSFTGKLNQIKAKKPLKVLVIENNDAVPMEFTKVETVITVDKNSLKKAVASGEVKLPEIYLKDGKASLIFGLIKGK